MADQTGIEWAHHTWSPWVGCTKVSPACDHCYAESWAKRAGTPALWQGERRRTSAAAWAKLAKWNRAAQEAGEFRRVFPSLCDPFDNQVPDEWRADMWRAIQHNQWLRFLLLTKRPQNIARMLPPDWGRGYWNVWLGTTAENQEEADRRIPSLLSVPAAGRFLSCEPLLGPIDLTRIVPFGFKPRDEYDPRIAYDVLRGHMIGPDDVGLPTIDWVICGGESGPGARPMHPDWARSLRDLCRAAGVPFFFKQWGEFRPSSEREWIEDDGSRRHMLVAPDGRRGDTVADLLTRPEGTAWMRCVGKKAAGRLLDGVEHNAIPGRPS